MPHLAAFAPRGTPLALESKAWGGEFLALMIGRDPNEAPYKLEGAVAIVEVSGPLMQHDHFLFDSYDRIRERARLAFADSAVKTVLLRIDSPGGEAAGCFELSRELRKMAAEAGKGLEAFTDTGAFSAAFALACAGSRITVTSTGAVGSIGVFEMMVDTVAADRAMGARFVAKASGKRKMDKNPHVPITPDAEAETQGKVDQMADLFFALVAEMRPMTVAQVEALEGSTQFGTQSVGTGLADQVSTWSALLARLNSAEPQGASTMSKFDEAYGAMKRAAEGDDEDAKKAKKCLKAWDDGDKKEADAKKAEEEEKAKKAKASGEESPEDKEKREKEAKAKAEADDADAKKAKAEADGKRAKEEEEAKAKAKAGDSSALALTALARVQALEAERDARTEADSRRELLASRPDFSQEMLALLKDAPLDQVKKAVETLPRTPSRMSARAAAAGVGGTRGSSQTGDASDVAHADADTESFIAKRMGLVTEGTGIVRANGGKVLQLGFMSPEDLAKYEKDKTARTGTGAQ